MILGMSIAAFTQLHTIISLIGIVTGLIAAIGLWTGKKLPAWTAVFLITTVLTSVTGFMFPGPFDPARAVGIISLVVLALAIYALYAKHLLRAWRGVYVSTALIALYLNCFVGVTQSFQKIPALHQFAPKGSEPPFAAAQLVIVALFVLIGVVSFKRFRPPSQIVIGERGIG